MYDECASKRTLYNYFRDYQANTGRYGESDPIGLAGGVNRYAYVGGNSIGRIDPSALEPPALSCGFANFLTGIADAASFGIGPYIRGLYDIDGGIDTTSGAYTAGEYASLLFGGIRGGYQLAARGISKIPGIAGREAVAMRNETKDVFRGFESNVRKGEYESLLRKYNGNDAEVVAAAGRTNNGWNAAGNILGSGAPVNYTISAGGSGGSECN